MAKRSDVVIPHSKQKEIILKILVAEKYVDSYSVVDKDKHELVAKLRYDNQNPAINGIKRISKPSLRLYVKKTEIPRILGGLGTVIISTPMGIMTGKEARKKSLGGELICKVW